MRRNGGATLGTVTDLLRFNLVVRATFTTSRIGMSSLWNGHGSKSSTVRFQKYSGIMSCGTDFSRSQRAGKCSCSSGHSRRIRNRTLKSPASYVQVALMSSHVRLYGCVCGQILGSRPRRAAVVVIPIAGLQTISCTIKNQKSADRSSIFCLETGLFPPNSPTLFVASSQ